jgi:hypothetical protein
VQAGHVYPTRGSGDQEVYKLIFVRLKALVPAKKLRHIVQQNVLLLNLNAPRRALSCAFSQSVKFGVNCHTRNNTPPPIKVTRRSLARSLAPARAKKRNPHPLTSSTFNITGAYCHHFMTIFVIHLICIL